MYTYTLHKCTQTYTNICIFGLESSAATLAQNPLARLTTPVKPTWWRKVRPDVSPFQELCIPGGCAIRYARQPTVSPTLLKSCRFQFAGLPHTDSNCMHMFGCIRDLHSFLPPFTRGVNIIINTSCCLRHRPIQLRPITWRQGIKLVSRRKVCTHTKNHRERLMVVNTRFATFTKNNPSLQQLKSAFTAA